MEYEGPVQAERVFLLYAENHLGGQLWFQSVHRSRHGASKEACVAMQRSSAKAYAPFAPLVAEERYEEVVIAWNAQSMGNRASKFTIIEATLQP